ncbi:MULTISPECIES: carbohydrate-binding family 9-like protein [Sphingobacterium]|uniref:Carbohydrate-binding domain-containing protein n=1 Tax=Sphingobacterium litopenaei TaxID=2763500 RepID=A0ABR7YDD8_9SPHI|nr:MULTISPECIES: carbohydrate-binding family 9-like protein [Sphingobacterium]MBD1429316.1 hypothetical protein [Sphingobacterium litopenaei]NGM71969.1 hypothetical protein [Sphingobacterium sp. SGL-16]
MSSLEVPKIHIPSITMESLKFVFKELEWHAIDQAPWANEYPYQPDVKFQIAYDKEHIFIHYDVKEEFVKASYIRPNENVWEDSCVEFFLSLDGKETYYNFEFNALGTGLIGYGSAVKSERTRLSAAQIELVDTYIQVKNIKGSKEWESYLVIPTSLFNAVSLEGQTYHANFYKCGDGLPQPHFLAWSTIDLPKPNFHQPQFFGEINFI